MDTPTISTLPPDAEEGGAASQTGTFVAYTPAKNSSQGAGKFRLNKIKLRLPERDPAVEEPPLPTSSMPTLNAAISASQQRQDTPTGEGEEDQPVGDGLDMGRGSSQQLQSTKPPAAKKARTRAPKNAYPGQSQVAAVLSQSSIPARAHGDYDTMISAWQVKPLSKPPIAYENASVSGHAPPKTDVPTKSEPGDDATSSADVKRAQKPPRKRAPAKPKQTASDATGASVNIRAPLPRVRRPAAKKIDDLGSGTDDTPPPTRPLQEKNDDNQMDIREVVDSGMYTLAPAHPLVTRPFPVQPPPKTGHSYATAPPLDCSKNRARHWEITTREIRTIAGGSWKARTWMGDEKSELAAAIPPVINVIHESSPAPSSINASPAKHPSIKRAQGQSKPRKGSKRTKELTLGGDSVMSSDVPQTREPSVDTEMLSLVGEGDADDGAPTTALPRKSGAKGQYKRRMGDAEMEEFLADD